jgi:hypothetical protein
VGNQPAAREGDEAECSGGIDKLTEGERSVLIGGRPAARVGDATAAGGSIVKGLASVWIGKERPRTEASKPPAQKDTKGALKPGASTDGKNAVPLVKGDVSMCRVDVRATSAAGLPYARHLYIVHTDENGNETAYRGGPSGPSLGSSSTSGAEGASNTGGPFPFGNLTTTHRPYVEGHVDWSPGAPSVTVASGAEACAVRDCLATESDAINTASVAYNPLGPNSNTAVGSALRGCELPARQPVSEHQVPGWGADDVEALRRRLSPKPSG